MNIIILKDIYIHIFTTFHATIFQSIIYKSIEILNQRWNDIE